MSLFDSSYAYRLRTLNIFEQNKSYIFDVLMINDDIKLDEFYLFENLWRETLLLHKIDDKRVSHVKSFGQLPHGIIYREVDEI